MFSYKTVTYKRISIHRRGWERVNSSSEAPHFYYLREGKKERGGNSFIPVNPYLEFHPWETNIYCSIIYNNKKTGNTPNIHHYENDQNSMTFLP